MNTKNFEVIGSDPYNKDKDSNLSGLKQRQIAQQKDKRLIEALLILFFTSLYLTVRAAKYTLNLALDMLELQLYKLSIGA